MNKRNPATLFSTEDRIWMAILLLNYKDRVFTVREFSNLSGLSLGFISQFSNLLKEAGYINEGRQMKLKDPGALLNILRDIYFFEKHERHSCFRHHHSQLDRWRIRIFTSHWIWDLFPRNYIRISSGLFGNLVWFSVCFRTNARRPLVGRRFMFYPTASLGCG